MLTEHSFLTFVYSQWDRIPLGSQQDVLEEWAETVFSTRSVYFSGGKLIVAGSPECVPTWWYQLWASLKNAKTGFSPFSYGDLQKALDAVFKRRAQLTALLYGVTQDDLHGYCLYRCREDESARFSTVEFVESLFDGCIAERDGTDLRLYDQSYGTWTYGERVIPYWLQDLDEDRCVDILKSMEQKHGSSD